MTKIINISLLMVIIIVISTVLVGLRNNAKCVEAQMHLLPMWQQAQDRFDQEIILAEQQQIVETSWYCKYRLKKR